MDTKNPMNSCFVYIDSAKKVTLSKELIPERRTEFFGVEYLPGFVIASLHGGRHLKKTSWESMQDFAEELTAKEAGYHRGRLPAVLELRNLYHERAERLKTMHDYLIEQGYSSDLVGKDGKLVGQILCADEETGFGPVRGYFDLSCGEAFLKTRHSTFYNFREAIAFWG